MKLACQCPLGKLLLGFGLAAAATSSPSPVFDESRYGKNDVIVRDVCIIGGGSGGTYAAIRLRDLGKSVVVVEKKDKMGGHTETYRVPGTDTTVDYGVVIWHDLPLVRNYFARLQVPLVKVTDLTIPGITEVPVNFQTGEFITELPAPSQTEIAAGLAAYGVQLAKYPYLAGGYFLPDPVPEELFLPFGDFVKKHSLDSIVRTAWAFAQGLANTLKQPTLYIMTNFGLDVIRNIQAGFLTTERHNNHELYEKARAELGADALLSSTVVAADRDSAGRVKLIVKTPLGAKLILAKKLLVAVQPKLYNLEPLSLDSTERSLFSQFNNSGYYTGLLHNNSIPDTIDLVSSSASAPFNIAPLPGPYWVRSTVVAGLKEFKYGSPRSLPESQVKRDLVEAVKRVQNTAGWPETEPEFVIFSSHDPFELTVSDEAIRSGFYSRLNALQGHRRTWYTGATWSSHDSSVIWNFTESVVLPSLLAS